MAISEIPSLRGKISLIWPIYGEELLYRVTEVTDENKKAIMKLVGLEFWGQEVATGLNKQYIYGIIHIPGSKVPPGVVMNIENPSNVLSARASVGGGKSIHDIAAGEPKAYYGCLFEKIPQMHALISSGGATPEDGDGKKYVVLLCMDEDNNARLRYAEWTDKATE
ncbi:MAG: hypothetical protein LBU10_01200 [Endomicrobium sp.]|jgi:hypothetical protein|nr:hypothetical protein [Endomicrobium sp.]